MLMYFLLSMIVLLLCYMVFIKKEAILPNPAEEQFKKEQAAIPLEQAATPLEEVKIAANADAQPTPPKPGAIVFKGFVSFWKKIWFFFQLRDAFWSVPLFWFLYYEVGVVMFYWFGGSKGFYDPSYIQPLFLAGAIVIGALAIWQFVLYFYFRSIHRWIWGRHRKEEQIIVNYSKDDFKTLTGWQRMLISFGLFVVVFGAVVVVYLKMR